MFDYHLRDREAKSHAATIDFFRTSYLPEELEQFGETIWVDTNACVTDRALKHTGDSLIANLESNLSSVGKLESIANQIKKHLSNSFMIAENVQGHSLVDYRFEPYSLLFKLKHHEICHISDCRPNIKERLEHFEFVVLKSGYVKGVINHTRQVLGTVAHKLEKFADSWNFNSSARLQDYT